MWIDIVLLAAVVLGLIKGWQHGFIISVFVTAAWILGVIGALKFCSLVADQLRDRFEWQGAYVPVVAFVLVFIVIAFVIYLIGKSLEKVIEVAHLGTVNKLLGVVLRVSIYVFVFSMFIWLINEAGLISPGLKATSKSYHVLEDVSEMCISFFDQYLPAIRNIFRDIQKFFEDMAGEAGTVV
jgi:membrane protein required for colicin V production